MAKVKVYPIQVDFDVPVRDVAGTTVTSNTDGCEVVLNGKDDNGNVYSVKDESAVIKLENTNSSELEVTVKAGDGWAAVNDYTFTLPSSSTVYMRFEGAKYKNKGAIILIPKTASALKVTAYNFK